MALAYRLDAISQGPKNSRIPGPNPLLLARVMDIYAYKTLCTGLINHRCTFGKYVFQMKKDGKLLQMTKFIVLYTMCHYTVFGQN